MNSGYIYALQNRTFSSHLIKIGMTTREPDVRAKEIYRGASGVPEPFDIAFACKVANCEIAEKKIHQRLKAYRNNNHREFFIIPIEIAKKVILSVCQEVNRICGCSTDDIIIIENEVNDNQEDYADDSRAVITLGINSIKNLVPSPAGTSLLSDEQKARVEIITAILAEVFPSTVDAWIMDFSRDHDPEEEIEIWEHIATAFLKIAEVQFLSKDQRKEAFYLLFLRAMMSASKVIEQVKLKNFNRKTAKEILRRYKLAPKPIVIQ